jgi:hypothetical protein
VGSKILLVEGPTDEHVLKHICGNRGVPRLDEVRPLHNVERLLDSIPVQLRASNEEDDVVGVVIDADDDLPDRWQSIRNMLVETGYARVPNQPAPDGTILDPPPLSLLPRAGIWIMPDNQMKGILETFLRSLIPKPSPLFDYVKTNVAAIPDSERRFKPAKEPKAIIHTWLAWQEEPGMPPGLAITAHYLDANVAEVDVLVSWLKRLFFSR